jgi:hypothetical protein
MNEDSVFWKGIAIDFQEGCELLGTSSDLKLLTGLVSFHVSLNSYGR